MPIYLAISDIKVKTVDVPIHFLGNVCSADADNSFILELIRRLQEQALKVKVFLSPVHSKVLQDSYEWPDFYRFNPELKKYEVGLLNKYLELTELIPVNVTKDKEVNCLYCDKEALKTLINDLIKVYGKDEEFLSGVENHTNTDEELLRTIQTINNKFKELIASKPNVFAEKIAAEEAKKDGMETQPLLRLMRLQESYVNALTVSPGSSAADKQEIIELESNGFNLIWELSKNNVINIHNRELISQYFLSIEEDTDIVEFLNKQIFEEPRNITINFDVFSCLIRFNGEDSSVLNYFRELLSKNEEYYYYNISESTTSNKTSGVDVSASGVREILDITLTQKNSENALEALHDFLSKFCEKYKLSIPESFASMLPDPLPEGGEYSKPDKEKLNKAFAFLFENLFKNTNFNQFVIDLKGTINTRNQPLRLCFEFMRAKGVFFDIKELAQYANNLNVGENTSKTVFFDEQSTPEEFLKQLRNNQIIDIGNYDAVLKLIKDKSDAIGWKDIGNALKIREGLQINFTGNVFASSKKDRELLDLLLGVKEKLENDGKSSVEMTDLTVQVYSVDDEGNRNRLLDKSDLETCDLLDKLEKSKINYHSLLYSHVKIRVPKQKIYEYKEGYDALVDALVKKGILSRRGDSDFIYLFDGEKQQPKIYLSGDVESNYYLTKQLIVFLVSKGCEVVTPKTEGLHSSVSSTAKTRAKKSVDFTSSSLKLAVGDAASEAAGKPDADAIFQSFANNWATAYSKTQLRPGAYEHKKNGANVVVYRSNTITTTKQDEAVLEVQRNQIQQVMRKDLPRGERDAIEKDLPELIAASLASMGIRLEAELKISGGTPDLQMRVAQLLSQNPPEGYGYKNVVDENGKTFELSVSSPVLAPRVAPPRPESPVSPLSSASSSSSKWSAVTKGEEGDTDEEVMSASAEEDVECLEGPAEGKYTRMPASTTFRPASSRSPSPMSDDDHTTVAEESPVRMPMSGR